MGVSAARQHQEMAIGFSRVPHGGGALTGGRGGTATSVDAELPVLIPAEQGGQTGALDEPIDASHPPAAVHQGNQPAQLLGDLIAAGVGGGREASLGAGQGLDHRGGGFAGNRSA